MSITIEEALFLMESLDNPYKLTPDYDGIDPVHDKEHGITNHKEYSIEDGLHGHLTVWHRAGAYEIHHTKDGKSGEWIPSNKPNSRFVATVAGVGQRVLKSGNQLRLIGHVKNGMFEHYNKLANIIAKRHGYAVTLPKQYTGNYPTAHEYNEVTMYKPEGKPAVVESRIGATKTRTSENNYGFIDTPKVLKSMTVDEAMDEYFK